MPPGDLLATLQQVVVSKSVISGSGRTVTLWEAGTGTLVGNFDGHVDQVTSVAFSTDGKFSKDQTVKLWDAGTCTLVRSFEGHTVTVVKSEQGWALVTKEGKAIGYVPIEKLHTLQ